MHDHGTTPGHTDALEGKTVTGDSKDWWLAIVGTAYAAVLLGIIMWIIHVATNQ